MSNHVMRNEPRKRSRIQSIHTSIYIEEFKTQFERSCLEHGCQTAPIIRDDESARVRNVEIPQLLVSYKGPSKEEFEKICYKNYQIKSGIILALQKCFVNTEISVLKLEFCNMTSQQVEVLSNLLRNNNSIMEVSVNGNPNEEQNFHLLLQETQITSLSLRFCEINSIGIEKLSKELSRAFLCSLLHLNLSSNSICDEGVSYIVDILRINRVLMSLNLADNKIYDGGCLKLVQPLQKFQLKLEEIIVRRRIRFAFFKKNSGQPFPDTETETSIKNVKLSLKEQSSMSCKKTSTSTFKKDTKNHPFVEDSYEEDKEIYCKGNNILVNINLCYNRITKDGLICLIQMLHYQRHMFAHDKGISRISIEGNDFNNNCEQELQELEKLIMKKLSCSSSTSTSISSKNKSQSSLRKRSSTAIL